MRQRGRVPAVAEERPRPSAALGRASQRVACVCAPRACRRADARRRARAFALALLACASLARAAQAYSYAAAGAEPLIDAREATLAALETKDLEAARKASAAAREEIAYLDEHLGTKLAPALDVALAAGDAKAVDRIYLEGFSAEVRRRITAAGENLKDYQSAKTLVVRSKRFVDLLAPQLPEERRTAAQQALDVCLAAIGNPGIFGVGAAPADPAAFAKGAEELLRSLAKP